MERLNLKQKLIEIRKHIGVQKKTLKSERGTYVDPEILLAKTTYKMNELGVLLLTNVIKSNVCKMANPTTNKKDQEDFVVHMELEMIFMDTSTDEKIVIPWFAVGSHMKDPAMAGGGGLTYYERYFIMKQFNIPTPKDDPEYLEDIITEKISKQQADSLYKIITDKGYSEKLFDKFALNFGCNTFLELPISKYDYVLNELNEMVEAKKK